MHFFTTNSLICEWYLRTPEGRGADCECPISVDCRFCADIDGAHDVLSCCLSFCGAVWPGRQKLHTGLAQGHLDRGRPGLTSLGTGVPNGGRGAVGSGRPPEGRGEIMPVESVIDVMPQTS